MSGSAAKKYSGFPVLPEKELKMLSHNIEFEDDYLEFLTSSEEPKRFGYSPKDVEELLEQTGEALEMGGLTEDDIVLSLGAPEDREEFGHLSQLIASEGPEEIGAEVVNTSADDYESIVEERNDVTAIISLPRATLNIGEQIQSKYGDIEDIFPEMRLGIFGGEKLTEPIREDLKDMWGFEDVRESYASTETGMAATENENGDLVVSNDNLYLEILEDGVELDDRGKAPENKIYSIENIQEPVTGSLLVSAEREGLPLIRYRLGDLFTAYPGKKPVLEFKGRERELINVSGHHMYPSHIEQTVRALTDEDWRAIVSEPENYTNIDVFLYEKEKGIEEEEFLDALFDVNKTIGTWYEKGGMEIRTHQVSPEELYEELSSFALSEEDKEKLASPVKKTERLAFASSYEPR